MITIDEEKLAKTLAHNLTLDIFLNDNTSNYVEERDLYMRNLTGRLCYKPNVKTCYDDNYKYFLETIKEHVIK